MAQHPSNYDELTRRSFLKSVAGATLAAGIPAATIAQTPTPAPDADEPTVDPVSEWQPVSDRKMRIAIVGGRFGASFHWHKHPNCEVTVVCDLRDDRLATLQKLFGTSNTTKRFRDLLTMDNVDAIGVFTPAPLHVWMATEAMKAGKHVISAVPAGLTLAELEQLRDCQRETGMTYMMAETSYFRPTAIRARRMARRGEFGTIFYSEAEYHHEGLIPLMYEENGLPTWRHGFPPMLYPTHSTGIVIPITNERLTEVNCIGWGDDHEVLQTNEYENPFWNQTAFFRTSGGHSSRISVFWHVAAGGTERGQVFGDRGSYIFGRPDGTPDLVYKITKGREVVIDDNGYPEGDVRRWNANPPNYWEALPEPLRVNSGHGGSHVHIVNEFVNAVIEGRTPAVDVLEALAYTAPGIVAHQSSLKGGEVMKVPDYGTTPDRQDYLPV